MPLLSSKKVEAQDYQYVVAASRDTSSAYSKYKVGVLPRARIRVGNLSQDIINKLESIESKERLMAEEIDSTEKILDGNLEDINDDEVNAEYQKYVDLRSKIYGKKGDAKQYIDSAISKYRLQYGCEQLYDSKEYLKFYDDKGAEKYVEYTKICIKTMQDATGNSAISSKDKETLVLARQSLQKTIDSVTTRIGTGAISYKTVESPESEYKEVMDKLMKVVEDRNGIDELSEMNSKFFDYVVEKQNSASGSFGGSF